MNSPPALHPSHRAGLLQEPQGIPAQPLQQPGHQPVGDMSVSAHLPSHPRGHGPGGASGGAALGHELVTAREVTPCPAGCTAQLSAAGNSWGAEDSHGFGCRVNPEPIHPPLPQPPP